MTDEKKAEALPQWAVEAAEEIHTYCGDECSALDTKVAIIARHASEREKTLESELFHLKEYATQEARLRGQAQADADRWQAEVASLRQAATELINAWDGFDGYGQDESARVSHAIANLRRALAGKGDTL